MKTHYWLPDCGVPNEHVCVGDASILLVDRVHSSSLVDWHKCVLCHTHHYVSPRVRCHVGLPDCRMSFSKKVVKVVSNGPSSLSPRPQRRMLHATAIESNGSNPALYRPRSANALNSPESSREVWELRFAGMPNSLTFRHVSSCCRRNWLRYLQMVPWPFLVHGAPA
eukprot:6473216-Amphidinium_carterae.1